MSVGWIITHVDDLEITRTNWRASLAATTGPDRTFTVRIESPKKEVTPSEEAELKKMAFRAVVEDETFLLRAVLLPRLPWDVWSRWRNAGGLDLFDLSQECGSQGAGALLSKEAWKWREVAWASVRDWACVHALVTKGDAFPQHSASCDEEGYMKLLDEQLKQGQATLDQQRKQQTEYVHQQAKQQRDQVEMQIKQQDTGAFVPAAAFNGSRPGYAFKMGVSGLGYYREGTAAQESFGQLSALIVLLPADLLALVLQYAHQGATRPWQV